MQRVAAANTKRLPIETMGDILLEFEIQNLAAGDILASEYFFPDTPEKRIVATAKLNAANAPPKKNESNAPTKQIANCQ